MIVIVRVIVELVAVLFDTTTVNESACLYRLSLTHMQRKSIM